MEWRRRREKEAETGVCIVCVMLVLRPVATEKERDLPMMLFSFTIHPSTSTIQSSKPPTPLYSCCCCFFNTERKRERETPTCEGGRKKNSRFIYPKSARSEWERIKETGVQKEGTKEKKCHFYVGEDEKEKKIASGHSHTYITRSTVCVNCTRTYCLIESLQKVFNSPAAIAQHIFHSLSKKKSFFI